MRGLDTETDKGRVILIAIPDNHLELWRYRVRDQWVVLLAWLVEVNAKGDYVCWNADYDCQAMLKLVSRLCKEEIYRRTRTQFESTRIRFVPSKFLWLAEGKSRVWIYDMMQFYSMSLEKASKKLLGVGKMGLKVRFSELLAVLQKGGRRARDIQAYCRTDALRVEQIYEISKTKFEAVGLKFQKPVSCASIASQRFGRRMRHTVPRYINRDFKKCFRGGRIEGLRCGYFARAWLSDIRAAYPSAMSRLRNSTGDWVSVSGVISEEAAYAAVLCQIHVPDHEYRGPCAVLGDTQLIYPRGRWSQWLDLTTYRLLESRDWIVKVKKGWQLIPTSDNRPFEELEEIYRQRKANPDQDWALKIVSNASYGKLAEQTGIWREAEILVPYHSFEFWNGRYFHRKQRWTERTNFVYASAITAGIRARMFQEISPESVIFFATDGVMTTEKPNLKVGLNLGEWSDPEPVRDLVVVGSGVYTYRKENGDVVTKLRGLDTSLDLYSLLDCRRRILKLTVRRNWSLAQTVRQHKYAMFNELVDVPRYLDVSFDRKRIWEKTERTGVELLHRSFESKPWFYYPPATYEEFD